MTGVSSIVFEFHHRQVVDASSPAYITGRHFFESHHRQVVDASSPAYITGRHFFESHHRQVVDASSPTYAPAAEKAGFERSTTCRWWDSGSCACRW
ncbi:MAG: hypothetical protein ACREEM_20505 [Blastocatellia bacterium]